MRVKRTKLRTYQFLNMASFRGRARLRRPSQWGSTWISNVASNKSELVREASRIADFPVDLRSAYDIQGRPLKNSIAIHALVGGASAKKFWEVYHGLAEAKKHKCQCSDTDLYEQGCKCGGG